MRHQPRHCDRASCVRREGEPGRGQLNLLTADRGRNVAGALPHPVALVARPVGQRDVHHPAAPGVGDESRQQEEVGVRRQEVEDAPRGVESGQSRNRGPPRPERNQQQRQDEQPSQRAHDHDPVEQLQRALDPPPEQQQRHAQQERADANQIHGIDVGRAGHPSGEQVEDRARRHARRGGPPHLQEEEHGIEPGPHDGMRPRPHEAGERRLAGGERVAHQLGVEDRLEEHGHRRDPEQRQAVTDEDGRAEHELAAADRRAEHDHAGPDGRHPAKPSRIRRRRELGVPPGVEAGSGLGWTGQGGRLRGHLGRVILSGPAHR